MTAIVVEDNEYAILWFHPETKIVHHEYKKYMQGEVFHAFLLKGTQTMKENNATKWLSDDRLNPVLSKEDVAWGQTNWFPQTVEAGWKYWAIVQPKSLYAKLDMVKLVKEYAKAGITAQFFHSPDDALQWLESLP